nr:DNA topoisomerase (ATP-hydrolyzing) [Salsipaludibacter albus]
MQQAFLDYSMSVIVGRALPDVRDGLKPVQRRILYSMWESGLHPDRPYRKCASAVGEVMKKYHPHGDTSIYDALVRMAQDFSTRELLVDGHGNFGSIDGDPPAAMRYTEARLTPLAMELLDAIDEETVDVEPNYDGYETQPVVLPARFPNLLVNGASGIAVGMATNLAPHNLGEVIEAAIAVIRDPGIGLDDLMDLVPAPDFPTGARIVSTDGIREAYDGGRGAVTMEAVATTETRSGNLPRIVVTEIPYQVNKSTLLERIADLVANKKFESIRDLRDESSRDGMRIVIELKRGEDPAEVLEALYRSTDLRTNFNVNAVALVDNAPVTLGLHEMLTHYVAHQRDVVTRRTAHRLRQARDRAHVLEGLLTALDHLDEVIALIRGSSTAADARTALVERFDLTDVQATAILDMRLRRLAALERAELEDEYQELQEVIAGLEEILGDPERLDAVLCDELAEVSRVHATPRRSRVVAEGISADDVLQGGSAAGFEARDVTALVTRNGYLKVLPTRRQTPAHTHPHDPAVAVVRATTDDDLLVVLADGTGYRVGLADVPVDRARNRGTALSGLLGDEVADVVGAVALVGDGAVTTVSASGQVKRSAVDDYASSRGTGLVVTGLKDDDRVAAVLLSGDDDHVVVATSDGMVTRFATDEVRTMGRTAAGVVAMNVAGGAHVISATVVPGGDDAAGDVVTVSTDGTVKRTGLEEYLVKGRGAKGVTAGMDRLAFCGVATAVHVTADPPVLVRAVDLDEARRASGGSGSGITVTGPVVAEQDLDRWRPAP